MSNYTKSADVAENQLQFISKSMCYAKWAQVSLHLTNGMTNSCYHPPLHKVDVSQIKQNPAALHNTEQKKQDYEGQGKNRPNFDAKQSEAVQHRANTERRLKDRTNAPADPLPSPVRAK